MERRWAQRPSVNGAMGRYVNPPPACRVKARLTGASQAPERLTALHPPLGGVEKDQTSGAKSRRENEIGCLLFDDCAI